MAINRVEIKKVLAFNNEFALDFCTGVNIFIGGNGTGKTTLLKTMYENLKSLAAHRNIPKRKEWSESPVSEDMTPYGNVRTITDKIHNGKAVYIPEKDILEHARGLLPFIEQKTTGFNHIYKDVLINAQDIPMNKSTKLQKLIGEKISNIIGGHIEWVQSDGSFYTIRTDGTRIPFASEASGFKKLGFLGLLVASGQLDPNNILFWDEPENSLNPEYIPILVDILLELSRNSVQIFIATHSELLSSYFAVNREEGDCVQFFSLYKKDGEIRFDKSSRFDLLNPNNLATEPVRLYEKQIVRGLGGNA